jgi:hypothetical protein
LQPSALNARVMLSPIAVIVSARMPSVNVVSAVSPDESPVAVRRKLAWKWRRRP